MKLKVCGMKYVENIHSVVALSPDYMGFIFYDSSPRNFEGAMPDIPETIKKTGVFVNAEVSTILHKINTYDLQAIQLHGEESVEYIDRLNSGLVDSAKHLVEIIKVFSVDTQFDFDLIKPYKDKVTYFLFDTKGKNRGGNGVKFDWEILKKYPLKKPFFLSGGIGLADIEEIKKIQNSGLPIYAIDVNSRFEIKPGVKNTELVKKCKQALIQEHRTT